MLNPLTVFNKETKKILTFSKINLLFGYGKSGKTETLSNLNSIFTGKDRHHLVNGTQTISGDFNVFYLPSDEGISNHLKLSSKSLIRRMINESEFSPDFHSSCQMIQKGINVAQQEIEGIVRTILPGTKTNISDYDRPLDLLLDNMSISLEMDSSSEEREELFSLVNALAKTTKNKTVVLIDDFNNNLDEESTINFLNKISTTDAYFILTSKKSIPQFLIDEETRLFAIRNNKIFSLPSLEKLVASSINEFNEYQTFEEYMISQGYNEKSGIAKIFAEYIRNDELTNILRILTAKNPRISHERSKNCVVIAPRTKEEENLYKKIFEMLEIPL